MEKAASLVARALRRSSFAVHEFPTVSEECCTRGYEWCLQTMLPDVVAPETHHNDRSYSLCELKLNFQVTTPELSGGRLHEGP